MGKASRTKKQPKQNDTLLMKDLIINGKTYSDAELLKNMGYTKKDLKAAFSEEAIIKAIQAVAALSKEKE